MRLYASYLYAYLPLEKIQLVQQLLNLAIQAHACQGSCCHACILANKQHVLICPVRHVSLMMMILASSLANHTLLMNRHANLLMYNVHGVMAACTSRVMITDKIKGHAAELKSIWSSAHFCMSWG